MNIRKCTHTNTHICIYSICDAIIAKRLIRIDFTANNIIILHRIFRLCSRLVDSSFDQIGDSVSALQPATASE